MPRYALLSIETTEEGGLAAVGQPRQSVLVAFDDEQALVVCHGSLVGQALTQEEAEAKFEEMTGRPPRPQELS